MLRRSGLSEGSALVTVMHEIPMPVAATNLTRPLLACGRQAHPSGVLVLALGRTVLANMSSALAQPTLGSIDTAIRERLRRTLAINLSGSLSSVPYLTKIGFSR